MVLLKEASAVTESSASGRAWLVYGSSKASHRGGGAVVNYARELQVCLPVCEYNVGKVVVGVLHIVCSRNNTSAAHRQPQLARYQPIRACSSHRTHDIDRDLSKESAQAGATSFCELPLDFKSKCWKRILKRSKIHHPTSVGASSTNTTSRNQPSRGSLNPNQQEQRRRARRSHNPRPDQSDTNVLQPASHTKPRLKNPSSVTPTKRKTEPPQIHGTDSRCHPHLQAARRGANRTKGVRLGGRPPLRSIWVFFVQLFTVQLIRVSFRSVTSVHYVCKKLWNKIFLELTCDALSLDEISSGLASRHEGLCGYVYPPYNSAACYVFSSNGCKAIQNWLPPAPARELTDDEIASRVVIRDILTTPPVISTQPKIAFLFLTPGALPFERLWDKFFQGHEGKFSVYVHASKDKPVHFSRYFLNREIRSDEVTWGKISMVNAERRLLGNALKDPDNQHFVLLSDSCVPLRNFDYVYNYLMYTNVSFVDCFEDPGPHGSGRYIEHMLPEVEKRDFRKGSQWFTLKRQHAIIIMADSLYYSKFRDYCKPGMEGGRNCYSDEHYLPTFFYMLDPAGIANWSVTHVDWSEMKWHPKSYQAQDVTLGLIKSITSIRESIHVTSDERREIQIRQCLWNGNEWPCYLFGRKFLPETLDILLHLFPNYTSI
ncbi:Core-2/I-branching beta-1-6-N-acetylglucosaminyltransferase family protein [Striga hermonthica]|uniref:Core-2/I-branching beta-1-6-N-acetylglucosaminyltransferase family protein n=1 Tax=Striga hermonthica TaxID=68872 RepID=A0A9N7MZN2_STRHE|nr:Core-2/I-branching beta-1-6-N-acetylglucosaminyltransferase family protein [Striga hermonthica]